MSRIGVLVVAYNAQTTLSQVLDRIPESFRSELTAVVVADDHSQDATYVRGLEYQSRESGLPLTVIRRPRNLGYGGNQKAGYRWAMEHELDVVVLLHGDGQYAPEMLPEMVAPLVDGSADAVFGSRMMVPGAARSGGMPLYKYWATASSPRPRTPWSASSSPSGTPGTAPTASPPFATSRSS